MRKCFLYRKTDIRNRKLWDFSLEGLIFIPPFLNRKDMRLALSSSPVIYCEYGRILDLHIYLSIDQGRNGVLRRIRSIALCRRFS